MSPKNAGLSRHFFFIDAGSELKIQVGTYPKFKVKVKLSLYRPWRPLGFREVEAPTFSDTRDTDGGKVVSPTRRPLCTPQEDSWYSFLLEAESTPGPKCGWKD
jgi:hypothetical protein